MNTSQAKAIASTTKVDRWIRYHGRVAGLLIYVILAAPALAPPQLAPPRQFAKEVRVWPASLGHRVAETYATKTPKRTRWPCGLKASPRGRTYREKPKCARLVVLACNLWTGRLAR